MLVSLIFLFNTLAFVQGQVTVHHQVGFGYPAPAATSPAAYNNTRLIPPAIPNPAPANSFTLTLQQDSALVGGLSIPHVGGSFWGFSIEMSVISQILGKNSSYISVPFLNLMSNLVERSGGVVIRLGGNTQEYATMVDSLPKGATFSKYVFASNQTTQTPAVVYTIDMFYMASNISSMLNVKWFLGIPFNDSANWRLDIADKGQKILGSNLLGLQAGNEPDYYSANGHRDATYSPQDYSNDVGNLIKVMEDNGIPSKNILLGPSVASGNWKPEQVWDTGFINTYSDNLAALTVEHYPNNNCAGQYGAEGPVINPQDVFSSYTTHTAATDLVEPYFNTGLIAQAANKPLYMFETNTAACGGFAGVSNAFAAALWAADYALQLKFANFTHGMLHTGGQNAFYNSFTAPPNNQSSFHQWTVGPIYYSAIVLAEAFGTTNTSQVIDLKANGKNPLTPAYAIYERNTLSKVVLINFMDDKQKGTNELQVTIQLPNGAPQSVQVKYLSANSISDRENITWAGQTLGNDFTVDGRFRGDLNVVTINCIDNMCTIPVPAPGLALVFFSNSTSSPPQDPYISMSQATKTFSTTAHTRAINTATVQSAVLATSNGHSGVDRAQMGGTSSRLRSNSLLGGDAKGGMRGMRPGMGVLVGLVGGGVVAGWALIVLG